MSSRLQVRLSDPNFGVATKAGPVPSFNAVPGNETDLSIYLKDPDRVVSDTVITQEHAPEQEYHYDLELRPQKLISGGKLVYIVNHDYTDAITFINCEVQFLYEPLLSNG